MQYLRRRSTLATEPTVVSLTGQGSIPAEFGFLSRNLITPAGVISLTFAPAVLKSLKSLWEE